MTVDMGRFSLPDYLTRAGKPQANCMCVIRAELGRSGAPNARLGVCECEGISQQQSDFKILRR
jgi:hypothetical protein